MQVHTGFGNDQLWLGSVKCFADGALGPQTAAMLMPYEGTQDFGTLLLTADQVFEIGMQAVKNGLSLAIHAIGDAATHEVLNGFGMLREFERRNHLPALNHRIEHLQLLHPDDLLKPEQLGITASMQPVHATSDMYTADRHWGNRTRYAYLSTPWRKAAPGWFLGRMRLWKAQILSWGCTRRSPASVQMAVLLLMDGIQRSE